MVKNVLFSEATRAIEEAVASDQFTILIHDEGPLGGKKRRKPETVATIEFPGYYQFTLKIDRNEGQGPLYNFFFIIKQTG